MVEIERGLYVDQTGVVPLQGAGIKGTGFPPSQLALFMRQDLAM